MDYRPPYMGTSLHQPFSISPGSNQHSSPHNSIPAQSPLFTLNRSFNAPPTLDRILHNSGESSRTAFASQQDRPSIPDGITVKTEDSAAPTAKRGSKACVACRKGKNRCEPDPSGISQSCKRCLANSLKCVFEKPSDKPSRTRNESTGAPDTMVGEAEGRVQRLEKTVSDLANGQSAIHGALNRILSMLPGGQTIVTPDGVVATASIFTNSVSPPVLGAFGPVSPQNLAAGRGSTSLAQPTQEFPKLPGFKPPNHQFGTYGIIPLSSAPASPSHSRHSRSSSSHSVGSTGALPQGSLTAPIQALEALANAANQAAGFEGDDSGDGDGSRRAGEGEEGERGRPRKRKQVNFDSKNIHIRVRKKTKPDPTPRNPFPDVVTKGLVSEAEARQLWDLFFTGCHYFVPLWDKAYDTYETYIERTPFSTNGLLAVAAKIRAGNGRLDQVFHYCLEEAQGIARSTLFGPIVRKEAAMAMLILSVWSQNGWLPCGHALRMALDMNLHRALDKMADGTDTRTDVEERDLVVSARIWMNCYLHDHLVSLGTGKPMLLRDESSVKHARILLSHRMTSETDLRLVAGVELVNLRVRVVEHLSPLHGKVDTQTISFVRRIFSDLQGWHREWLAAHRQRYDEHHVLVKLLEAELVHAQLWTVCVALRGVQWDKLAGDSRELAFQAKDAAQRCLEIYLRSSNFRSHLKFATHDQLVSVAFAAIFLLKMALLYPESMQMTSLISEVSELSHMLANECFAERYALTLRLMLSSLRRKTGAMSTVPGTPRLPTGQQGDNLPFEPHAFGVGMLDSRLESLLTLPQAQQGDGNDIGGLGNWNPDQELDNFSWPTEFSPSNLPVWLQDGNFADLGLPADGSDSLFLPPELANMFLPGAAGSNQFTLPDSADVGAEAW